MGCLQREEEWGGRGELRVAPGQSGTGTEGPSRERSSSPKGSGEMCTEAGARVTQPCLGDKELSRGPPQPSHTSPCPLAELALDEVSLLRVRPMQLSSTPGSKGAPHLLQLRVALPSHRVVLTRGSVPDRSTIRGGCVSR